jgi:hypothetical protein
VAVILTGKMNNSHNSTQYLHTLKDSTFSSATCFDLQVGHPQARIN